MAMIKCTECGKEISDKAEKCPNCGCPIQVQNTQKNKPEKKKNSGLSTWAAICAIFTCTVPIGIILAIIDLATAKKEEKKHTGSWFAIIFGTLVIISLIFMAKNSDDKNVPETVNISNTEEVLNENEGSESLKNEDDERNISQGESFENNGLKVTINDADTNFTDYKDEYDLYNPANGMKYIMVSFTFENTSDSDKYVSIYDFDCYADNTACEQAYLPDDSDFINANLSSGRNVSFKTYYSVPIDAESIELEYTANIWTGEKVVVKVK